MELTKRAKDAEIRALNKIRNNINEIYDNPDIRGKIDDIRKSFGINGGLYDRYNEEADKKTTIKKLTEFLITKWAEQVNKDKEVVRVLNRYQAEANIKMELKDEYAKEVIKQLPAMAHPRYLMDIALKIINGESLIYNDLNINRGVWKRIIGAYLFTAPQKAVINLRESMLSDFMPKINDRLQIQINEQTKMGDIEYIEPKIKKAQEKYKIENGLKK
jgi:hypothetical protein